ncbi:transcriptional regulator, y4mF family [compost metagenome]
MNNSNSTFASRLTLARKEKGLTQKILAEKIGIHVTNIIKYEKSKATPRANVVNKLAEVLDMDHKYLLNGLSNEKDKTFTEEDVQVESLSDIIEEARKKIAKIAKVSADKVTIQVSF